MVQKLPPAPPHPHNRVNQELHVKSLPVPAGTDMIKGLLMSREESACYWGCEWLMAFSSRGLTDVEQQMDRMERRGREKKKKKKKKAAIPDSTAESYSK